MTERDAGAAIERPVAVAGTDRDRSSTGGDSAGQTRRQFLGAVGASVAAAPLASRTASAQERQTVSMGSNYFDPVGLHVEPGTTVRFEIVDGSHSATAYEDRIPGDADTFDSGTVSEGGFEHTFETPGTYDYYCRPHRAMGMTGRIVVGEPGGPAEESPIPDGSVPGSESISEQGVVRADDATDSGGGGHGGGMSGGGMGMDGGIGMGGGHGLMALLPVGVVTAVLGLASGALYLSWDRRQADSSEEDDALATLERAYARGEIDDAEFERRRERLTERE